jgi:hypothetical protein
MKRVGTLLSPLCTSKRRHARLIFLNYFILLLKFHGDSFLHAFATQTNKIKMITPQSDPRKLGSQQRPFELFSCDRKSDNPWKNTKLLDGVIPGNCNNGE